MSNKCKTCGGSGEVDNPVCVNCSYYPLGNACLSCNQKAKVPCPSCQQGELVKELQHIALVLKRESLPLNRLYCARITNQAAARIEELEKENRGLKEQPRCPCGGELEGLGRDIRTKDEVWQCKKCIAQIIIEPVKAALGEKP